MSDSFSTRSQLNVGGKTYDYFSLPTLGQRFDISHLPYSMKILLENLLRHEDGGITAQLRVSDLPVQADGEDRPDAARLASQGPGEQFALYVDRALFLRSDAITIQLGSFYRLTYAPA